ncbi:hypothetical protein HYFRA_00012489 [Hymenoscyphus fraxineus]|uniref:BZIP domain-containing protein n=1 Tax=Hymenoscyphus fraxineus TaxID=746836 RepID=A0A9N9L0R5_9HELO|nr:hypothetical protein HYFRA_00012489 [Hymenoscyphus fraxineus]
MALSNQNYTGVEFDFDSILSEMSPQRNLSAPFDILSSLDYTSFLFAPDGISKSLPTSFPKSELRKSPPKMQLQDNSESNIWWSNEDQPDIMYPGLEIESTGFEFGNTSALDSPLPDHDSWSTLSSPSSTASHLPKSSTPEKSTPVNYSYLGKSTTPLGSQKPKATKIEKLEKRREKNRTSQRRYRERKEKYIQDLENQLREVQRRCELLQARLDPKMAEVLPTKGVQPCEESTEWQWPEIGPDDKRKDMEFN